MKHTHALITNKFLRRCFAAELREARAVEHNLSFDMRWGMESGIWAVQKALMKLTPLHLLKNVLLKARR